MTPISILKALGFLSLLLLYKWFKNQTKAKDICDAVKSAGRGVLTIVPSVDISNMSPLLWMQASLKMGKIIQYVIDDGHIYFFIPTKVLKNQHT